MAAIPDSLIGEFNGGRTAALQEGNGLELAGGTKRKRGGVRCSEWLAGAVLRAADHILTFRPAIACQFSVRSAAHDLPRAAEGH